MEEPGETERRAAEHQHRSETQWQLAGASGARSNWSKGLEAGKAMGNRTAATTGHNPKTRGADGA